MMETNRFPILVFVLIVIMFSQQEYQGVKADEDDHREEHKLQVAVKQSISRPLNLAGSTALDILCQGISFINRLLNINFFRNLCKDSIPYETTTNAPGSTTQPTTIKPLTEKVFAFSAEGFVHLTCDHVPGTIKLIDATFGYENSSCPPISMASNLTHYTTGKTSVTLTTWYVLGYCLYSGNCNTLLNCNGTFFFNGTYTCTPGPNSMVADAFDGSTLVITCPTGTIAMDSAVYGSIDGVTCPPTSVLGYPAFQSATSGLTSFSVPVFAQIHLNNLCSTGTTNKLSVVYSCQSPAPTTMKSLSRRQGDLHLVCPVGEIDVTSLVLLRSAQNSSCSVDATTLIRSLVPSKTTEGYWNEVNFLASCNNAEAEMMASYTCVDTAVSQFTLVAQEFTHMVLKCPYGQKIHLVTSKFYCATNSSEKVYQNPAGVVRKCDRKEGICYFYVEKTSVLDIPFNPSSAQYSLLPNCPPVNEILDGHTVRLRASMLSITYTCEKS